jgi:hypothetical protein
MLSLSFSCFLVFYLRRLYATLFNNAIEEYEALSKKSVSGWIQSVRAGRALFAALVLLIYPAMMTENLTTKIEKNYRK